MTRVLVVDDEIDTLNLLRTILDISGYEAITTLNSMDAITLAEIEHPDCVLLDIMMPNLDGFTLCKMMRLHPATANLPIVFVTAYSALDLEDRRKEAGADMVLPKPIGMDVLISTVEKATTMRLRPDAAGETRLNGTGSLRAFNEMKPTVPDYGKTAVPRTPPQTGLLDIDIRPDRRPDLPLDMTPGSKPDVKTDAKPDVKPDTKTDVKVDVKPEISKPEVKSEIKHLLDNLPFDSSKNPQKGNA